MHDTRDLAGAISGSARRAFAAIDIETVLEIAQFAIRLPEIPQRRSPRRNRLGQDLADHRDKAFQPRRTDVARLAPI